MNVVPDFYPFNSCGDGSRQTGADAGGKVRGSHKSLGFFSGHHRLPVLNLMAIVLRYFSLDQSGGPTDQPADMAVNRAWSLVWLKNPATF